MIILYEKLKKRRAWSEQATFKLIKLVAKRERKDWSWNDIGKRFNPNRSAQSCKQKYKNLSVLPYNYENFGRYQITLFYNFMWK